MNNDPSKFRLATLHRLRQAEREQRRVELGQAQQAERLLQQKLAALQAEIQAMRSAARSGMEPGKVDLSQLLSIQRYELVLEAEAAAMRQQVGQVAAEVERRREALTEADRQLRVLDKLRQRQRQAYEQQQARQEQKQLDELSQRRRLE